MNVSIFLTILAFARAAVVEDLLTSAAQGFDDWASSISSWNSGVGYDSAMIMQLSDYNPLSVQVSQLSENVQTMPAPDNTGYKLLFTSLANLTSSVAHALSALNEKAADYYSVGANQVIGTDISLLSGEFEGIFNHIVDYMPESPGCDTVSDLASALDQLTAALSSGSSIFSTSVATFSSLNAQNCTSAASSKNGNAQSSNAAAKAQANAASMGVLVLSSLFAWL